MKPFRPVSFYRNVFCLLLCCAAFGWAAERVWAEDSKTEKAEAAPSDSASPTAEKNESDASSHEGQADADAHTVVLKGGVPEKFPFPDDPRPYLNSPYAEKMDKALAYVIYKNRDVNRLYSLLLMDYLQRKFGLHERYALKATFAPHLRDESDKLDEVKYGRFLNANHTIEASVIEEASEQEKAVLKALYCDQYPMSEKDMQAFYDLADQGLTFQLFQCANSYIWMRDKGCAKGSEKLQNTKEITAAKLRRLIMDNAVDATPEYMAVGFLYGLGKADLVQEEWIAAIANHQRPDGGWASQYQEDHSGQGMLDATVFALWALLEHALPDMPDTPWLPNPEKDAANP